MADTKVKIGDQVFGDGRFGVIGGPCVIEDEKLALDVGFAAKEITEKLGIPFVYKSSYLKDNRSSKAKQTQLALALGETGKPINVKKAQFFTPQQTEVPISKIESTGNKQILLTERGSVYGYGDIVFDPRNLVYLKDYGYPVLFDVTHVVRLPGKTSIDTEGGLRGFIPPLARAAAAIGCDGLFLEFHPCPQKALCDAASMLEMDRVEWLLKQVKDIHDLVSEVGDK